MMGLTLMGLTLPPVYPILDTASLNAKRCSILEAALGLIEGGAKIVQLRHKGHWSRDLFGDARRLRDLCRESDCLLVTNDRADIAALLDSGLHLGQDDLPPVQARCIVAVQLLGFSTHNAAQLRAAAAEPVDYVALGPVFDTASKDKPDPLVGLERLREWRRLTEKPLVAIGGVTRLNAADVWEAGADSLAVISDLLPGSCSRESIRERMQEWQQLAHRR